MTLLLGPPSSGKTTMLLALAGRLGNHLQVSGKISYNGHGLKEFVPQRTLAYVSQQDWHIAEMTVKETLELSARCQGVGFQYGNMSSLVSHDKLATLETILKHGRDNKHDKAVDFPCRLFVQRIRNNNDWFVLSCGGGNCMKGVEHGDGGLWCVGCENPVVCPTASFRLELEVTDSSATAVIVLFDDVVRSLTRTTAGSILAAQSGFSPANSLYATAIAGAYTPIIVNNSDGTKSSLPACLQSLADRTWDFVLASHTYYHHGDYESFICKIVGSDCFVPTGIASSPPATPSTSSKPVIVIQTPAKQLEPKSQFSFPDSDSDEDVGSSTNER